MSAIAGFVRLPIDALPGLRKAAVPTKPLFGAPKDTYWDFLKSKGSPAAQYDWSGYVIATVLCCLQEAHQIDLMTSSQDELANFLCEKRRATHFILTNDQRESFLERTNPSHFDLDELRDFYNAFEEADEPEAGPPMMDGVRAIHEALSRIDQRSVVLLYIA